MRTLIPGRVAKLLGLSNRFKASPEKMIRFRYYQFQEASARFFYEKFGRTEIEVADTPHYRLALALAGRSSDLDSAEKYYKDFLISGRRPREESSLNDAVSDFKKKFEAFRSDGGGVSVTQLSTSGDYYVVDGLDHLTFSAALRSSIVCTVLPFRKAFGKYSASDEFYGTGNSGVPYQSVWFQGKILLRGRRTDALERLRMIPSTLLQGSRILDVACNIGVSSILASRLGARECVGLEVSEQMVDTATRMAMFEGVYPAVCFRRFDLDANRLDASESFEVAFMFSIYRHLKNVEILSKIAEKHITKAIVFEAHPGDEESDYEPFFKSGLFRKIENLGELHQSTKRMKPLRKLWLLSR